MGMVGRATVLRGSARALLSNFRHQRNCPSDTAKRLLVDRDFLRSIPFIVFPLAGKTARMMDACRLIPDVPATRCTVIAEARWPRKMSGDQAN